jgi:PhnB protein
MKSANPYLNFNGNTEQAFDFYKSVFGGEFLMLVRFKDFPGNGMGASGADLDKIAHIALPLGGSNILMGTDTIESFGQKAVMGTNFFITLEPESVPEAERVFTQLAEGGTTQMPLQSTEWAEKYGSCVDKFGVQWMVSYTGNVKLEHSIQR